MIRVFSVHTFSFRYTLVFVGAEGMMVWSFGVLFVLVEKKSLSYLLAWAYYWKPRPE